jgi:hypothetical protein
MTRLRRNRLIIVVDEVDVPFERTPRHLFFQLF